MAARECFIMKHRFLSFNDAMFCPCKRIGEKETAIVQSLFFFVHQEPVPCDIVNL